MLTDVIIKLQLNRKMVINHLDMAPFLLSNLVLFRHPDNFIKLQPILVAAVKKDLMANRIILVDDKLFILIVSF